MCALSVRAVAVREAMEPRLSVVTAVEAQVMPSHSSPTSLVFLQAKPSRGVQGVRVERRLAAHSVLLQASLAATVLSVRRSQQMVVALHNSVKGEAVALEPLEICLSAAMMAAQEARRLTTWLVMAERLLFRAACVAFVL